MKCPYTCCVQDVTQTLFEYDEDGKLKIDTLISKQTPEYIDCIEEECAVYYDGKCHYKG